MRRNKVQYNAFSDDERDAKSTVVNAFDDDDDDENGEHGEHGGLNEEEEYLREIRREKLLNEILKKQSTERAIHDHSSEDDSDDDKEEEAGGGDDDFDEEEKKEMEQFKHRLEQRRELQRSRSGQDIHYQGMMNDRYGVYRNGLSIDIHSFNNPEIIAFLESNTHSFSSSSSSQLLRSSSHSHSSFTPTNSLSSHSSLHAGDNGLVRVNSLKTAGNTQNRRLVRQKVRKKQEQKQNENTIVMI